MNATESGIGELIQPMGAAVLRGWNQTQMSWKLVAAQPGVTQTGAQREKYLACAP